ncbi:MULTISPECIES: hypothetical protein [Pseudomonas]|uniref:Uncharacterized protein n=1 Tax=Pseudomonas fluorescens TaxID=294 RepID=A0A161ZG50_PSEFL|nr:MULTISPECIES: hypothetical protein [Pseudomonas]KZN20842.1 hypothetical protein A1D17_04680 [Pseudomonas fluorescens]
MNSNIIYVNFRSQHHAQDISTSSMVQLLGWPSDKWAEVVAACKKTQTVSIVHYSEEGDDRKVFRVPCAMVTVVIAKRDIPMEHFHTGSIDLAQGKLGRVCMRWSQSGPAPRSFG